MKEALIIAYGALILNYEPAYDAIEGKWLTNVYFLVVHRIAVSLPEKVLPLLFLKR
ncbi:MAG: hypothetical protein QM640_15840 [Niabella sp.]